MLLRGRNADMARANPSSFASTSSAASSDAVGNETEKSFGSQTGPLLLTKPIRGKTFITSASPASMLKPPPIKPTQIAVKSRGVNCVCHLWTPLELEHKPRGVVVLFHGLKEHANFPTVRYLAELLVANDYIVYGPDFPGHGSSPGLRGYISSADGLITDGANVSLFAKKCHGKLPLFLAGSSLGGAVALAVAGVFRPASSPSLRGTSVVSGLILLSPVVRYTVSRWHRRALRGLVPLTPRCALFSSELEDGEMTFRDQKRRDEINRDSLRYQGKDRVASVSSFVDLASRAEASLEEISMPLVCLLGKEDVVVDHKEVLGMMAHCHARDKCVMVYDALHGLLCEPQPLRGAIERDLLDWLHNRAKQFVALSLSIS